MTSMDINEDHEIPKRVNPPTMKETQLLRLDIRRRCLFFSAQTASKLSKMPFSIEAFTLRGYEKALCAG